MENELINIKDLSIGDRPREKLIQLGASGLSNAELLAIILRSGSASFSLISICKELVEAIANDISNLACLTVGEIAKVRGVGEVKAITLLAAIELGRRSQRQTKPLYLKDDRNVEQLISIYLTSEKIAQYH